MSGAGQAAVRVTVDPELCMGSGTCMAVAPTLFEMATMEQHDRGSR